MRARRLPATLVFLAAVAAILAGGAEARAQAGLVVQAIRFEGNQRYTDENLILRLKLKVDQRYDDRLLEEDIKTLYRFFREVRVEKAVSEESVTLVFHVVENPRIVAVRVVGNEEFETTTILDRIRTERGYPLFEYALVADRRELARLYREKGYHFVDVRTEIQEIPGGKVVVFRIQEGPQVDIDEIQFRGNVSLEADALLKVMASQEAGFLKTGLFVQEALERDIVSVMEAYRAEGFRDVRAWLGALDFTEDKEDARIRIDVEEGEPYVIDEIRIEGGETYPEDPELLKGLLTIAVGDRFRLEEIRRSLRAIETFYKENAYWGAIVRVLDPIYRAEGTGAALVFQITEGETVSVDRIVIEGNEKTKDKVIRRQITIVPGGPLNAVELQKSIRRLRDLRYFTGPPQVAVRDTADPGRKDVVFRVEEGQTGQIRFSAGVNSNLGLLGNISITKRNFDYADLPSSLSDVLESRAFTGGGQTLRLTLSPGTTYSTFRVNFREPWLFDRRLGGEFDFYRTALFRPGYDIERLGFTLSVDKRWRFAGEDLDDLLSVKLGFRTENPNVTDVDEDDAPDNAIEDERVWRIRSLKLGGALSRVDSRVEPSRGWIVGLDYEWGSPLGSIEFHEVNARASHHWTVYTDRKERGHVFGLTGAAGWQKGIGDTDDLQISERFFLGGLGSVRGFGYRTIGPKSNDEPEGGEAYYRLSAEYNFPLYERLLGGVVFVDSGNVTERWGGKDFLDRIRVAPGVGLRISIPFLGQRPVELAFGIALKRHQGDDPQVFSFSFGRDF